MPSQVIVVWQGDDTDTRDAAMEFLSRSTLNVLVLHLPEPGIVPAENLALDAAVGDVVLLIDDDAVAPATWLEKHLQFYSHPEVGAVGGGANNFNPDGSAFPRRSVEPTGRISWWGRLSGNMYDHPDSWSDRKAIEVQHLVGYNMSLRRCAFDRFESGLRRYWQLFELDACLQVQSRGYRVMFDFSNTVDHYPTNTAFTGGRSGDLAVKVINPAFNKAYVFSKHFGWYRCLAAMLCQFAVGSVAAPGVLGMFVAVSRFGKPVQECRLFVSVCLATLSGCWSGGWARSREGRVEGLSSMAEQVR